MENKPFEIYVIEKAQFNIFVPVLGETYRTKGIAETVCKDYKKRQANHNFRVATYVRENM